jgi:hypothetical protein
MTDKDTRALAEKLEDARGDGACKERADFMVWMAKEARSLASRDEILAGVARGDRVDAFERQERRQAARERLLAGVELDPAVVAEVHAELAEIFPSRKAQFTDADSPVVWRELTPGLLTTAEVAAMLRITSPATISNWLEGGSFPGAVHTLEGWRFDRCEVEAVILYIADTRLRNHRGDMSLPDFGDVE